MPAIILHYRTLLQLVGAFLPARLSHLGRRRWFFTRPRRVIRGRILIATVFVRPKFDVYERANNQAAEQQCSRDRISHSLQCGVQVVTGGQRGENERLGWNSNYPLGGRLMREQNIDAWARSLGRDKIF